MNKKIVVLAITVLALAMFAVPVMAKPTKGPNKVAVSLFLTQTNRVDGPDVITGNVIHLTSLQTFEATIKFDDVTKIDLIGTLVADRKIVVVEQKEGNKVILTDYYVFTFPGEDEDTGFEGNAQVILDGMPPTTGGASSKARGLFHGTGDFEGQTLNVGHGWEAFTGTVKPWTGYWLKYVEP